MKSAVFAIGPEVLRVERVGREFAVIRASGEVHEHRTYQTAQQATSVAIRLSNQLRRERKGTDSCGE